MTFAAPWGLLAIPALTLVAFWLFRRSARRRRELLGRFASERLVPDLLASYSARRQRLKEILILLALACLGLALARPQWGHTWQETRSRGIDVVFALDASRSMLARDLKPNRLERAKLAILDFVEGLDGDRVGLVAFAGNAFLQCPLTLDYDAFRQSLEAVDTSVISLGGTDLGLAIEEAEAAFAEENNHKIVVLITDGEDLEQSGVDRATAAAENGVTIYAVGVGTPEGGPIPLGSGGSLQYLRDSDNETVLTRLDAETLASVASATGGFYVPLGPTGSGLREVYERGLATIPDRALASELRQLPVERFQWPLGIGILLLFWEMLIGNRKPRRGSSRFARLRRSAPASVALAGVLLLPLLPDASGDLRAAENETADALHQEHEAEPSDSRSHLLRGNRLYAEGSLAPAGESYLRALQTTDLSLQADAFFNLGNTRHLQGRDAIGAVDFAAIESANREAAAAADSALRGGRSVLDQAVVNRIPPALRRPEDEDKVVPQETIRAALQAAEGAKEATGEALEVTGTGLAASREAADYWKEAADAYDSSLELAPHAADAQRNRGIATRHREQLGTAIRDHEAAMHLQERHLLELEEVIEELRKLLEDPPSEDSQGEDGESGEEQEQEQQQDGSEGEDEQTGEGESGEGDSSNDSGDSESPGEPEDNAESQPETGPDGEESAPGESGGEEEGESTPPEPIPLSEEQQQEALEAAAREAAEGEEQGEAASGEQVAVPVGVMTREDARRLLDSLKRIEKKLPTSNDESANRNEPDNRKDW